MRLAINIYILLFPIIPCLRERLNLIIFMTSVLYSLSSLLFIVSSLALFCSFISSSSYSYSLSKFMFLSSVPTFLQSLKLFPVIFILEVLFSFISPFVFIFSGFCNSFVIFLYLLKYIKYI